VVRRARARPRGNAVVTTLTFEREKVGGSLTRRWVTLRGFDRPHTPRAAGRYIPRARSGQPPKVRSSGRAEPTSPPNPPDALFEVSASPRAPIAPRSLLLQRASSSPSPPFHGSTACARPRPRRIILSRVRAAFDASPHAKTVCDREMMMFGTRTTRAPHHILLRY
jgi:hypothetical protein